MNTDEYTTHRPTDPIIDAAIDAGLTPDELTQVIERYGREIIGGYDMRPGRKGEAAILAGIRAHAADQAHAAERVRLGGPPATPAQVDYLRDLGATDDQIAECTKAKASALIDELKARQRREAREWARS